MTTGTIPWPKKEYPPFEIDIDAANLKIAELQDLIATWSRVAEALGNYCYLRRHKFCFLECPGQMVCNTEGLHILENLADRMI